MPSRDEFLRVLETISKPLLHSVGYGSPQASSGCIAISLFDMAASPSWPASASLALGATPVF